MNENQTKKELITTIAELEKNNSELKKMLDGQKDQLTLLQTASQRGFFRSTNIFRLIGLGILLASSFLSSPDVDILGIKGNALALTGVVLVAAPTLKEILSRIYSE